MFHRSTSLELLHKIIRSYCNHVTQCWPQQLDDSQQPANNWPIKTAKFHRVGLLNTGPNMFATDSAVAFRTQFLNYSELSLRVLLHSNFMPHSLRYDAPATYSLYTRQFIWLDYIYMLTTALLSCRFVYSCTKKVKNKVKMQFY
jgi:hypothetical protein